METRLKLKALGTLIILCFSSFAYSGECETKNNEIPLEKIQAIFSQMQSQSKWNTSGPMVWGYFFFDHSQTKLSALAKQLEASGYKTVELFFNGKNFTLHVERIEAHTPESLYKRGLELGEVAKNKCIRSYDGFDVGPYK